MHPRCRCTIIASFGEKMSGSRISEGRKRIPAETSYKEWRSQVEGKSAGALNNRNDPTYEKRDKVANEYYDRVRGDKENFIKNVAANSGLNERGVEKVFNHIFIEKHQLDDGFRRFDPSYEMAESFRRLSEGNDIQEHDRIILIKHEWLELGLMKRYGYDYSTAHRITERKYNYDAALTKWLKERGEW